MKRIVVALDGSDRANLVLSAAARLAELADAKLVLFRAINVPSDMPREVLALTDARLEDILQRNAGRTGHIFNLGHGILPETPVEHAKFLVETVHRLGQTKPQA